MIFQSRHVVIRYITVLSVEERRRPAGRDDIMLLSLTQTEEVKNVNTGVKKSLLRKKMRVFITM